MGEPRKKPGIVFWATVVVVVVLDWWGIPSAKGEK
jgi:hypothetical protein